jgi:hypothetical protein
MGCMWGVTWGDDVAGGRHGRRGGSGPAARGSGGWRGSMRPMRMWRGKRGAVVAAGRAQPPFSCALMWRPSRPAGGPGPCASAALSSLRASSPRVRQSRYGQGA